MDNAQCDGNMDIAWRVDTIDDAIKSNNSMICTVRRSPGSRLSNLARRRIKVMLWIKIFVRQ